MTRTPTPHISSPRKGAWRLSLVLALTATLAMAHRAHAQGCVAIHGSGISSAEDTATTSANNIAVIGATDTNPWALSFDYRYFNSLHDYIGTTENARLGTGVYNKSNFTDIGVTYIFDSRWSATFTLPFVVNDRSQVTNGLRFHTDATGFGDASI
ncbi:MAG TPA: hypothetical protein VFE25_06935, partial [Opitutaceae bacterium]|nr:hypothetical protein [Opitutaceae bacterium]